MKTIYNKSRCTLLDNINGMYISWLIWSLPVNKNLYIFIDMLSVNIMKHRFGENKISTLSNPIREFFREK